MPQASDSLRAKFPGYDSEAEDVLLGGGWTRHDCHGLACDHGAWWKPPLDREPTNREWDAIDYLINEWDHALESWRGPRHTAPADDTRSARGFLIGFKSGTLVRVVVWSLLALAAVPFIEWSCS